MASLRDQILEAGVARVNALGNGWTATTRDKRNPRRGEKLAVFVDERESKLLNSWFYDCTLFLVVGILAYHEQAGTQLVYRYLDTLVADVERVVHLEDNEQWGVPAVTDIAITGHRKFAPDPKKNIAVAELEIRVRYRHNIGDPDTYGYPDQGGGGGPATNALGLNVGQLRYWTSGILFKDLGGQGQPWWNQRDSGDWSQNTPAAPADADGYPTDMPAVGWWATTLLVGQDDYPSGRYVVTYDGVGTLAFGWDAVVVTSAPGRVEIDVTPSGQGIYVQLTATQVGDHLRNLQILPGVIA